MKTENRPIEKFARIKLKDFGTIILTQGEQEALVVEADQDLLPDLITEVRNSTLA